MLSFVILRLVAAWCLLLGVLGAGSPPAAVLEVDRIFAPQPAIGRMPDAITWAPDGTRFLFTLPGGETGPLDTYLYLVASHRAHVFFRAAALGKGSRPAPEFVWSPDSRQLAFLDAGDLWVIGADGRGRRRLARDADDPQWSPDSRRVAYVHAGDLYALAVNTGVSQRFSFDGSDLTLNGDPDWVYSEELEMRHAYCWSPDGNAIAYLRFDQRPITPFPIVDFLAVPSTVLDQRYPLAGSANSRVTLRLARAGGATRVLYSTGAAGDYVASVGFSPAGVVTAQILDRAQQRLRYVGFGATKMTVLYAEHDAAWVDLHAAPRWIRHGRQYLFLSDRAGQTALMRGDANSGQVRALSHGITVTGLVGVDERRGVAFVQAAYPTRRDSTLLMVPLAGGAPRPVAEGRGAHEFHLAADAHAFVRRDSRFGVPPVDTVGSTLGGRLVRLAAGTLPVAGEFGATDLFTIDSPWGKLDAYLVKPPHFDPRRRYPVIMYVYGGPAAPTTADVWGGTTYLFHQALAQRGFLVFSVDGPGSQIDSAAAVRLLYHRLGPASLAGQLAGVDYLRALPFVDSRRIGLWGWSFGGYETTYALTHAPGTWKAGVAVAPVTDWRNYDTIYTERYMGTPAHNPLAYRESSALEGAARFAGRLLIAHGTGDDNVHLANSVQYLQAMVLAGKHIDFTVFPRKTHGITGIPQRRLLFTQMLDYWIAHL